MLPFGILFQLFAKSSNGSPSYVISTAYLMLLGLILYTYFSVVYLIKISKLFPKLYISLYLIFSLAIITIIEQGNIIRIFYVKSLSDLSYSLIVLITFVFVIYNICCIFKTIYNKSK